MMVLASTNKFDLNLIRFLMAIVETSSMVNAAEILDVAPSAVSYAVKKLREHYNDPLFVRSLHGVKPTALAYNLYDRFKIINEEIVNSFNTNSNISNVVRKIYIRADSLTEFWITNRLLDSGIIPVECTVEFKYSVINAEHRCNQLRNQEIDLDIGLSIPGDRNIISYDLFDWDFILICRDNHSSVGQCITKKQFASEPFVGHYSRFNPTILHNNFNKLQEFRTTDAVVMSETPATMILNILSQDLLMFIPRSYFPLLKKSLPLREVKCDFLPVAKISNFVHLNKKNSKDKLLEKIITTLKQN